MHVSRQVGPPKVRLHGGHEIEHSILKRKLRHRGLSNLDAAHFEPACIGSLGYGNALLRIIDTVDLPPCGRCRQLAERPSATAAHVQDGEILLYANVPQAPI